MIFWSQNVQNRDRPVWKKSKQSFLKYYDGWFLTWVVSNILDCGLKVVCVLDSFNFSMVQNVVVKIIHFIWYQIIVFHLISVWTEWSQRLCISVSSCLSWWRPYTLQYDHNRIITIAINRMTYIIFCVLKGKPHILIVVALISSTFSSFSQYILGAPDEMNCYFG